MGYASHKFKPDLSVEIDQEKLAETIKNDPDINRYYKSLSNLEVKRATNNKTYRETVSHAHEKYRENVQAFYIEARILHGRIRARNNMLHRMAVRKVKDAIKAAEDDKIAREFNKTVKQEQP